jgi:hypothetical protein
MQSWERAYLAGECNEVQSKYFQTKPVEELYDIAYDPWEVNNLADDPEHLQTLIAMRGAYEAYARSIFDAGFIPEADRNRRAGNMPVYDYIRSEEVPYNAIFNAAQLSTEAGAEDLETLRTLLKNEDSAVRYWAAMGLKRLGKKARSALPDLQAATMDPSFNVTTVAAETLYRLGDTQNAINAYLRVLESDDEIARTDALNSIDRVGENSEPVIQASIGVLNRYESPDRNHYDIRMIKGLLEKWNIDPEMYGIEFNW